VNEHARDAEGSGSGRVLCWRGTRFFMLGRLSNFQARVLSLGAVAVRIVLLGCHLVRGDNLDGTSIFGLMQINVLLL
jgi:hypothetical protein